MRKVALRLVAILFIAYLLNYLDRTNIGIAKLRMASDLGLSSAAFGLGAGIFFIGYAIFEVPSNLILHRVGPRAWIARIMISWGVIATVTAWVNSEALFYLLRVLLGIAEAGFVPGILLYLHSWAPARYRARFVALFLLALPLSSVVGNPLGGWLLNQSWLGLSSWRLMFIVEGIPSVLLGLAVLALLTPSPSAARWLRPQERVWLVAEIERDAGPGPAGQPATASVLAALRKPRVLAMCGVYFGSVVPVYTLAFFMPTMLVEITHGTVGTFGIGWLAAIPYGIAAVALVLISHSSDRRGERRLHYAVPAAVGGLGLVLTALTFQHSALAALIGICLGLIGCISTAGAFWSEASVGLAGAATAVGLALVNTVGNAGGFVSPYVVGWIMEGAGEKTGSTLSLVFGAVFLVAASILMAAVGTRFRVPLMTEIPLEATGQ
jgi:MFS family permease